MYSIGLDVHKRTVYATVLDEYGKKIAQENLRNDAKDMEAFIGSLGEESKQAVIEASSTWMRLFEQLMGLGVSTKLANPLKVKAIAWAKIKTDKIDSEVLAQLLRADMIPESYVPDKDKRELRDMTRQRAAFVRQRTRLKNHVHALLAKNGITHEFSDVFGKGGMEFLKGLELQGFAKTELDCNLRIVEALNAEIAKLDSVIRRNAKADRYAEIAMTMPGISYYSALLISAEIGDIGRFPDHEKLCSWAGLVPSVHSSGDNAYYGRITKQGSAWLRGVLVQCANVAVQQDCPFRRTYLRLSKKKGHNVAVTAVARKMLKVLYYMLKNNEPYKYLEDN